MTMFVEKYQISGLKALHVRLHEEARLVVRRSEAGIPHVGEGRKLGLKNIGCHKGIPFGQFMARYAHPEDLDAVCDDFTDLKLHRPITRRGLTSTSWPR